VEPLEEGAFLATSTDLPGLVVQGRTQAETMELAQANARILMEVYLSDKLPLPPALRRLAKRKAKTPSMPLPVARGISRLIVGNETTKARSEARKRDA
jgi:predicted RNase H-like HicB family nuclease